MTRKISAKGHFSCRFFFHRFDVNNRPRKYSQCLLQHPVQCTASIDYFPNVETFNVPSGRCHVEQQRTALTSIFVRGKAVTTSGCARDTIYSVKQSERVHRRVPAIKAARRVGQPASVHT